MGCPSPAPMGWSAASATHASNCVVPSFSPGFEIAVGATLLEEGFVWWGGRGSRDCDVVLECPEWAKAMHVIASVAVGAEPSSGVVSWPVHDELVFCRRYRLFELRPHDVVRVERGVLEVHQDRG